jgi:hypothetical protein
LGSYAAAIGYESKPCTGLVLKINATDVLYAADAAGSRQSFVCLIAWDNGRMGMGYRTRSCGDYLIVLQKPPIVAKPTWSDHGIPDRWIEKVDRNLHPHVKPIGLIRRLIGTTSRPGDLVVDPCAGSFTVMHAALALGREFIGCDIAYGESRPQRRVIEGGMPQAWRAPPTPEDRT